MRKQIIATLLMCFAIAANANDSLFPGSKVPDLTKGGKLTRINQDWIGPVGIQCGVWRPNHRGNDRDFVRQLLVLDVEEGSPGAGILAKDDVIIGVDGTGATKVPLIEPGQEILVTLVNAITEAEARNPALLKLLISRPAGKGPSAPAPSPKKTPAKDTELFGGHTDGKIMTMTIKLETLGRYSDTAPYACEKSKTILRRGIKKLYEDNQPDLVGFNMLCLLAADDPTNPDSAKIQARAKEWAHKIEIGGGPWFSGPRLISLSEYYMKTKDETIFPKLVKQAEHHARGVSWFGTTGHKWADKRPDGSDNGPMSGYGPIGASGVLGYIGLSLAREAGVKSAVVEATHERQRIFFGHYAFRGAPSYGEFFYGIGGGNDDNNGKCAMSALSLGLDKGQEEKAKYYIQRAALTSYSTRTYAHGGVFFGQMWQPLGAALGGEKVANFRFRTIRPHLDYCRRWNHARIYDGSGNSYKEFGWGSTALLFYALPLKQLYITGRGQKASLTFSNAEVEELITAKSYEASKASNTELIAALSKEMLRGSASAELANRVKAKPSDAQSAALMDQLLALAADSKASPSARTSACDALRKIKEKAGEPLASLKNAEMAKTGVNMLKDPAPYIRFGAGRLLQDLNPEAVMPYANQIMDAIIATGRPAFPLDEEDPLQASHSVMGELLFNKLLGKSLEGVDRKKLILAAHAMLETPSSEGRNSAARVLEKLSLDEVLELADVIVYNARYRAPANAMAGTGYMNASRNILATHLFEEGLPLSLIYGGESAVKAKIHEKYGRAGFTMQPAEKMIQAIGDMMLAGAQLDANAVLEQMQKATGPQKMPKLKTIHSVKAANPTLTLPAAKTELVADARNYAFPDEGETTYTWRKVYGAGNVSFAPNASGKSKTTTVSFTDPKPGKYRFEVTMSDNLGYTEVSGTVDVILYDKNRKLPANRPPVAQSQALAAVPGKPGLVQLSGTDPDGDDLGFAVTKGPSHGRLSGIGGKQIYTAEFGFTGTDSFTFQAIDGQGATAEGQIQLKVSDQNVGVAVYEGFDYPTGGLHDKGQDTSFGFSGPWVDSRASDRYWVEGKTPGKNASLSYPSLPSTGGRLDKGQRHTSCSRRIDRKLLSDLKMLAPGGTMWFSFFISDGAGRSLTFKAADTTFGIKVDGAKNGVLATLNGETGSSRNAWSRSSSLRFDKGPHMIIGRCLWGKTDADPDTVEAFRVYNAPGYGVVVLEEPVSVVQGIIPQEAIESMGLFLSDIAPFDEIRVGPTRHSVMAGTTPLK